MVSLTSVLFTSSQNHVRYHKGKVPHISLVFCEIWGATVGRPLKPPAMLNRVQCLPAVDNFVQGLVYQVAHLLRGHSLAGLLGAE